MTFAELAAQAENAVDALGIAINDQPMVDPEPEVANRLHGIVQSITLALAAIAVTAEPDTAQRANKAADALLPAMPALTDLAEAIREAEYRRAITDG